MSQLGDLAGGLRRRPEEAIPIGPLGREPEGVRIDRALRLSPPQQAIADRQRLVDLGGGGRERRLDRDLSRLFEPESRPPALESHGFHARGEESIPLVGEFIGGLVEVATLRCDPIGAVALDRVEAELPREPSDHADQEQWNPEAEVQRFPRGLCFDRSGICQRARSF